MARNPARTPRPAGRRAGGCLLVVAVLVFADGQLYIDNGAGVIDDYALPGGTRG